MKQKTVEIIKEAQNKPNKPKMFHIRKTKGLGDIIVQSKNGVKNSVKLYSSDSRNRDHEGTLEGDYKGKTMLDTKHFMSPWWIKLKNEWAWGGEPQRLGYLIDKMKLTNKDGNVIKSGDNVMERLSNRFDEVFQHKSLYGNLFMENGKVAISELNPLQEFLYWCNKGRSATRDKSDTTVKSKFVAGNVKYEITTPQHELRNKKKEADKDISAIKLLSALSGDEERMRAVAEVMDLPGYTMGTEPDGVFMLIKDTAVSMTDPIAKYGKKSPRDRFLEVAGMNTEELDILQSVMRAKNVGIIRRRKEGYLMNGEELKGVTNEMQLLNFFANPENQNKYSILLELIDNHQLIGKNR